MSDKHESAKGTVYGGSGPNTKPCSDFWHEHMYQPTGRSIWLCHHHYDSPFGPDREAPETWWNVWTPIGSQGGTFFKTSKVHDGMTVWLWGGRHPDDVPMLAAREKALRDVHERKWARA